MMKTAAKDVPRKSPSGKGRISARFRNCNIALFAVIVFIMLMAMSAAFYNIIWRVSSDYSRNYAASSEGILSTQINSEIALLAKAASSNRVIDWLNDEHNPEKRIPAFLELSGILRELYSNNMYVGVEKSLHEYSIGENYMSESVAPRIQLDENDPEDAWYFRSAASEREYELDVAMDNILGRKRVWINYKVVHDGKPIGVISTGLDFFHMARELFSHFDSSMRGFIIDRNGIVNMDSSLLDDGDFLTEEVGTKIEDEINDAILLAAIKSHLDSIEGYFETINEATVIKPSFSPYRYATIAPIRMTDWSVVILYDSSSTQNMSLFLPALIAVLVLFIAFALANSAISRRLIFLPLERLIGSLERLKEGDEEQIYCADCDDEFGELSNTIHDLFTKANYDALTGIHNRRFMEDNLHHVMEFFRRPKGLLSVLMIDIDFFKKYNDTYGHEQGDVCLKSVATALAGCVTRKNDVVARYGGEEFIVVLPNTDADGACLIAQKLLDSVRALDIPHAGSATAPHVTISVGVATGTVTFPQIWEDYSKRADEALYMSKQNGRNRYTYLDMVSIVSVAPGEQGQTESGGSENQQHV